MSKTGKRPCHTFRDPWYRLSQQFQIRISQMFIFHPTGPASCYSTQFFICNRSTIRMISFLHIATNTTHSTAQYSSSKSSKMCAYAVHSETLHHITKYNGNCKRQISQSVKRSILRQDIFFLIISFDQDLHRPSRFRVCVFLLDISSRTIYSFINYVKLYQSRACNTGNAKAVKP